MVLAGVIQVIKSVPQASVIGFALFTIFEKGQHLYYTTTPITALKCGRSWLIKQILILVQDKLRKY